MLDHMGITVSDIEKSKQFYLKALSPLGIKIMRELTAEQTGGPGTQVGFGNNKTPFFWISDNGSDCGRVHIAFKAKTAGDVDAFYQAAIEAGGKDNGVPGLRLQYRPNYYAAFVRDLDGHNIEAVCRLAE